jgi:hypothetical protein
LFLATYQTIWYDVEKAVRKLSRKMPYMGINQKDFNRASNEAVRSELRIGEWRVFDHYEIEDGPHGMYVHAPSRYQIPAPELSEGLNRVMFQWDYLFAYEKWGFRPLVDTPALFLEFAGLIEEGEITQDVWLDWIERYGVLGFESNELTEDWWWANPRGGPRETLIAFKDAAWQANAILRIYEAATAPDGPDTSVLRDFASKGESHEPGMQRLARFEGEETAPALAEWGLRQAWKIVGHVLAGHCYPELYRLKETFDRGWGFKSLLGAMYLQMMWLMTATDEPPRCKGLNCNRFITIEQLDQHADASPRKKYRTRNDKEFCSNRCKNRWHYHYGGGKYSKNARRKRQV